VTPLRQSEVTSDLTAASTRILHDAVRYPLGSVVELAPGIVARVEMHTWIGATGEQRPGGIRGVSLYHADPPANARAQGIDVSSYQPQIDWAKVAADGVSFAFVKATEGTSHCSATFPAQWNGARAAGLLRGAYHFFRVAAGTAQIDSFVDVLAESGDLGDLPPVLDVEWQRMQAPLAGVAPEAFADAVEACVDRLASLTRRRPLVYTAPGFWPLLPMRGTLAAKSDLWLAKYGPEPAPGACPPWPRWAFWQYTDRRNVPGIGQDDANVFCGSLDELRAYASTGALPRAPVDLSTVAQQQDALRRLGYDPGPTDGRPGPHTTAAVEAFQRAHGLAVTGTVGPLTVAALRAALDA